MPILVTGAAGFIGFHVCRALLDREEEVVGLDDLNSYYDVALKERRRAILEQRADFTFHKVDLADRQALAAVFARHPGIDRIVHLAAQAGVRYSLTRLPFSLEDPADQPRSLYGSTKRSGELIARSYAAMFKLPMTGLRFFTVYGPWGRPDMSAYLFTQAILEGRPITLFNNGEMKRDFTYIDDIVSGVVAALDRPPRPDETGTPHRLYNLGNHRSEPLKRFVELIETACGRKAQIQHAPMQPGDVLETFAEIEASRRDLGFEPKTPIDVGIPNFVTWFREYHKL